MDDHLVVKMVVLLDSLWVEMLVAMLGLLRAVTKVSLKVVKMVAKLDYQKVVKMVVALAVQRVVLLARLKVDSMVDSLVEMLVA